VLLLLAYYDGCVHFLTLLRWYDREVRVCRRAAAVIRGFYMLYIVRGCRARARVRAEREA
jgi:hypothetical protein